MENKKVYFNGKCYDKTGKRASIFGELFGCQLVISYFLCSPIDQYSYKFARKIWTHHEHHTIEEIKKDFGVTVYQEAIVVDPIVSKREFNQWMNSRFYKLAPIPMVKYMLLPADEFLYWKIISKGHKTK